MKPTIEKKVIAQVRFYETLYVVRDKNGEVIFTGSQETAKRIQRLLSSSIKREKRK